MNVVGGLYTQALATHMKQAMEKMYDKTIRAYFDDFGVTYSVHRAKFTKAKRRKEGGSWYVRRHEFRNGEILRTTKVAKFLTQDEAHALARLMKASGS